MRLPDASHAIVTQSKIQEYLLARHHVTGRMKARFFERLGFSRARWQELRDALTAIAVGEQVAHAVQTPFGEKYLVHGIIRGPKASAALTTVWILTKGSQTPQLVTAYPRKGRHAHAR